MEPIDVISTLAHAEGRRIRPMRDADVGTRLPFFTIGKNQQGRWLATGRNAAGHDNEGRMPFVVDWLNDSVLPMTDPSANIGGSYRIELHDSYTYLNDKRPHDNALVFGRPVDDHGRRVALIPDTFQMGDYSGLVDASKRARHLVPWNQKTPKVFFAGSTTGDRDPKENERIRACLWSLRHPEETRFVITNIVQMDPLTALRDVPSLRQALSPPVAVDAHWTYKYQANIAGNTACWSRVPMIMASSCLMMHLRQLDVQWFYPALADGIHYVGVDDFDDFLTKRTHCMANDAWCKEIVSRANRFVDDYLTSDMAAAYMVQLLEAAASWNAP